MSTRQSGGIAVEAIQLLECQVGEIKPEAVKPEADKKYNLGLMRFARKLLPETEELKAVASFDLMSGVKDPPCRFTCVYAIHYSAGGEFEALASLSDHVIIAHILPFMREFVWNVTMRMPVAGLMMPPVNAVQLVERFKQAQAAQSETTPSPSPQ